MPEDEQAIRPRLYGRQKSHPLSLRQQRLIDEVLPSLRLDLSKPAPADLTGLFGPAVKKVWLEIGFGAGEHLAWQLDANPDVGIIGCEPFLNGTAKLLAQVPEQQRNRLRLYDHDARTVIDWLPDNSINRAFILFPDPWPKRRHRKRRLVAPQFIANLTSKLAANAELRFATDIDDYKRTGLAALLGEQRLAWQVCGPQDWQKRTEDWPATRYEAKAAREGRTSAFFRFVKQ